MLPFTLRSDTPDALLLLWLYDLNILRRSSGEKRGSVLRRNLASVLIASALLLAAPQYCSADGKPIKFETIPAGARVEVNGTVACTTPCSFNIPSEYLSFKFAFSKHAKTPIIVRLLKDGCAPKTVNLTAGPIRWRDTYAIPMYTFYQALSQHFVVQLEDAEPGASTADGTPRCGGADPVLTRKMIEAAGSALVTVSVRKDFVRGFLLSSDGLVATDGEFVADHDTMTVTFPDGKSVKSSQKYVDPDYGLGLVKVGAAGYPNLLLSRDFPHSGADVFNVAPPPPGSAAQNSVSEGIVGRAGDSPMGRWVVTDRPLDYDIPGTPLIDRQGRVVGISTARNLKLYKGENVWQASRELDDFVKAHFNLAAGGQQQKH